MAKVTGETLIDAPSTVVWDIICDLEAYPEWMEGFDRVEVTERDEQGRPTTATIAVGIPIPVFDHTITAEFRLQYRYGPDHQAWTLVEGRGVNRMDGRFTVQPDGAQRTRVAFALDVALPVPLLLRPLEGKAADLMRQHLLGGLKQRAEARAGG